MPFITTFLGQKLLLIRYCFISIYPVNAYLTADYGNKVQPPQRSETKLSPWCKQRVMKQSQNQTGIAM